MDYNNSSRGAVINGSSGNDRIVNAGGDVCIYGLDGDDYIENNTDNTYYGRHTVRGEYHQYEYISGGYYEYSYVRGYVTINAGRGNDTIDNADDNETYIQYTNGDGDDVLINNRGKIQIADGSLYTRLNDGDDQVIRVGLGSIRVRNAANQTVNITGGALQELATVEGTNTDDNLSNIRMYAIVDAGNGNDTVTNFAWYTSLGAGDGDDYIINAYSSSINGGRGNDSISLSVGPNIIEYTSGDGYDTIVGYSSLDTVKLLDDSEYSTLARDNDVIIYVGEGSILLKDAADKMLNIVGGIFSNDTPTVDTDPHSISNSTSNTLIVGTDDDDTIRNQAGGVTIDGGGGDDFIYNWDSASSVEINGGDGSDSVYNDGANVTIDGGAEDDYLENFGASVSINGGGGDDTVWNYSSGSNVTINAGAGDDRIRLAYDVEVINYMAGDGNDTVSGYSSTDTINIADDAEYRTLISGEDVIISLEGGSITLLDAAEQTLNIIGGTFSNDTPTVDADPHSISNSTANTLIVGTDDDDTISNVGGFGSSGRYVTIRGGAGDDVIINSAGYSEINGGTGNDVISVSGFYDAIEYASGDGNDIIYGCNATDTIRITDDAEYRTLVSGNDVIISLDSGSMTLIDAAEQTLNIIGGTYIDTTPGDDTIVSSGDAKLNKAGTTLTVKKNFEGTLRAADYGDNVKTIKATAVKSEINIVGNALDNKITTGKYGSTITGGGGNDVITLGKGVDVIRYASGDGNDTIKSYKAGDELHITDGELSGASLKGSAVILNVGDGSLTVKSVKNKEMTIVDAAGVTSTYKFTKQNNDLESARVSTVEQAPTEYWFEADSDVQSPLSEIITSEAAVDPETILKLFPPTRPGQINLPDSAFSARSRRTK